MSVTAQNDVMEMYKQTKEKLANWPLMTCTDQEKTQWFKDTIGPTIAKITLSGDRVDELIVIDDLYDAAAEAMTNMSLPADFPDQNGVTRDQLERDFAAYVKQIIIRTATIEQLSIPDDSVAPEHLFIRPITSKMKVQGFINEWDRAIGFTDGLKAMGSPFDYTLEEKKILFGFSHLMNCIAMQSARQQQNNGGNVEMFKME